MEDTHQHLQGPSYTPKGSWLIFVILTALWGRSWSLGPSVACTPSYLPEATA